jgi:hypothetical protein
VNGQYVERCGEHATRHPELLGHRQPGIITNIISLVMYRARIALVSAPLA